MANETQLEILKKGIQEWNDWRDRHPTERIDLSEVKLPQATRFSDFNFPTSQGAGD